MSSLKLATKEAAFIAEEKNEIARPKPVLVTKRREHSDFVARRVAEVVDLELANGNMPA